MNLLTYLSIFVFILILSVVFLPATKGAELCRSPAGGYCFNLAGVSVLGFEVPEDPGELIAKLYVYGMGLVGISALIVLVAGGVLYLTAGDNESRVKQARTYMGNAVFGLVIALLSWLILYTINPDLVQKLKLQLKPIAMCAGGQIWCEPLNKCTTENQCVQQGFGIQCACPDGLKCVKDSCPSGCNPTGNQFNIATPSNPDCNGLACPGGTTPSCQCPSGTTPVCVSGIMRCQTSSTANCNNVPASQRPCGQTPSCSCPIGTQIVCSTTQQIWICQ